MQHFNGKSIFLSSVLSDFLYRYYSLAISDEGGLLMADKEPYQQQSA